jgi:hypothetical protein
MPHSLQVKSLSSGGMLSQTLQADGGGGVGVLTLFLPSPHVFLLLLDVSIMRFRFPNVFVAAAENRF